MLARVRALVSASVQLALEVAGLVLSVSGAAVAVFVGKLFLAVVFAAIALGFVLRLSGRGGRVAAPPAPALPRWVSVASGVVAVVTTAALVEATNLPVRYDHVAFHPVNWALVVASLVTLFLLQLRVARTLFGAKRAAAPR